jgi:hypothetical protein
MRPEEEEEEKVGRGAYGVNRQRPTRSGAVVCCRARLAIAMMDVCMPMAILL